MPGLCCHQVVDAAALCFVVFQHLSGFFGFQQVGVKYPREFFSTARQHFPVFEDDIVIQLADIQKPVEVLIEFL